MGKIEELVKKMCPNGVEYKTIGEIATYRRGSFPQPYTNSEFYGGKDSMPFVQVADIEDYGLVLKEKTKQTISKIAQSKSIFVPKGNVICSIQGTIGRVAITQYDAYVDRTIAIFNGFKIDIDKYFFAYCIQVKFGIEKKFARGSTLKTITKEEFTKFRIPVPPLDIQHKIVDILNKFIALSTELSHELTARQKQYEYYKEKLLHFEKNTKYIKLKEIVEFKNGKGHERVVDPNGQYILVTSKAISTNMKQIRRTNANLVPLSEGDITMVMSDLPNGKALAKCFLVDEDNKYTLNQRIGCFINKNTKEIDTKFLFYILNRNYDLLKYDNRVDQTNLRKDDILNIEIPIPPKKEQERIACILDKFNKICNDELVGLPAEIEARQKQYEYYRDKLLTFKEL